MTNFFMSLTNLLLSFTCVDWTKNAYPLSIQYAKVAKNGYTECLYVLLTVFVKNFKHCCKCSVRLVGKTCQRVNAVCEHVGSAIFLQCLWVCLGKPMEAVSSHPNATNVTTDSISLSWNKVQDVRLIFL